MEPVKADAGIAIVHRWVAEPQIRSGAVVALRLTRGGLWKSWQAVYPRTTSRREPLLDLVSLIRNARIGAGQRRTPRAALRRVPARHAVAGWSPRFSESGRPLPRTRAPPRRRPDRGSPRSAPRTRTAARSRSRSRRATARRASSAEPVRGSAASCSARASAWQQLLGRDHLADEAEVVRVRRRDRLGEQTHACGALTAEEPRKSQVRPASGTCAVRICAATKLAAVLAMRRSVASARPKPAGGDAVYRMIASAAAGRAAGAAGRSAPRGEPCRRRGYRRRHPAPSGIRAGAEAPRPAPVSTIVRAIGRVARDRVEVRATSARW